MSPFVPAPPATQLPAFPLLAALPQEVGPIAWGLPVIAVIVGVGVGLIIARGSKQPALVRLGLATAVTVLIGLALGLVSALASGSLGNIRLATIGPDPILVGLLAFALLSIGAIPTAIALRRATEEEQAAEEQAAEEESVEVFVESESSVVPEVPATQETITMSIKESNGKPE